MKNVYLIKTISPLHLSHASNNTTSQNIGGTDAWAVPALNFWGTVPQSSLGLRTCKGAAYSDKLFT